MPHHQQAKVAQGTKLYKAINTRHQSHATRQAPYWPVFFKQFLYCFGIEASPICECDNDAIESVQHYLLHCLKYERQHAKLMKEVGIGGMWIEKLLGYPEMIQSTMQSVKETKRFN